MNSLTRTAIVVLVAAGVATAIVLKQRGKTPSTEAGSETSPATVDGTPSTAAAESSDAPLPRLLDLGANKCIPCKQMAPILEALKQEFAGRLNVEFIDVWEKPDAAEAFNVKMIPTQIFFDASGKELFRHTGFYGREDILAKWSELNIELTTAEPGDPGSVKTD